MVNSNLNGGVLYRAELFKNTDLLIRRFMLLTDTYITIVKKAHFFCISLTLLIWSNERNDYNWREHKANG